MDYLSQVIGLNVYDAQNEFLGHIQDISIATDEAFPRIKRIQVKNSDKATYNISWSKYVASYDDTQVRLSCKAPEIKTAYLQDAELFVQRHLMDKDVIDLKIKRVVHLKDLRIQPAKTPRILGADYSIPGRLKRFWAPLESLAEAADVASKRPEAGFVSWTHIELIDEDLSELSLSPFHRRLTDLHPADLPEILEELEAEQRKKLIERLGLDLAADAVIEMEEEEKTELISELPEKTASSLIEYMDPDDAADLISELPQDKADKILRMMNTEEEETIRKLLSYEQDSAGGMMTSEFVALSEEMSAEEALNHLRKLDEDHESVHYLYTLDPEQQVLSGVLSIRTLALAPAHKSLKDLAFSDVISVNVDDKPEAVYERIAKYDLIALPVVDAKHELVGIITVDDALDVADADEEKNERNWKRRCLMLGILSIILACICLFLLLDELF